MPTILCIATYFKGEAFLRECRRQGCVVLLLTADPVASRAWPREAIDEMHTVPREAAMADVLRRVDAIARTHRIDKVAALDDFDVETAAAVREHLQLPGLGRTAASHYRDKLAMRTSARAIGLAVPEFTPVFTDSVVAAWTERVAPPWVLKPRSSAATIGIKKIADQAELWRALEAAGDLRSQYLLEAFVTGDVYHVDSIVWRGKVVFAVASKYGRPPMEIAHQGGIFVTRRLRDDSAEGVALLAANRRLQSGLGMQRGVSHTEFIVRAPSVSRGALTTPRRSAKRSKGRQADTKPDVVFLETSARVGGAFIADTVEAATGIDLWREWARIEIADEDGEYTVPAHRDDYAGLVLSLARQPEPDTSAYVDPEIVTRIRRHHHAGLIVGSPDPARVETLLADYTERFRRDFYATEPPPERVGE